MTELIIRPSWNDHQIVGDLLAPGGARVVIGAHRPGSKAQAAHTLTTQANRLLEEVGATNRIHHRGYEALEQVTEELRRSEMGSAGVAGTARPS